jgi:hypothetical protein
MCRVYVRRGSKQADIMLQCSASGKIPSSNFLQVGHFIVHFGCRCLLKIFFNPNLEENRLRASAGAG